MRIRRTLGLIVCGWFFLTAPFVHAQENLKSDLIATPTPSAFPEDLFEPKEKVILKVNIPAARLDLYINDRLIKSYRVAVGMPKYPTPTGELSISYIVWNPWWIPPASDWAQGAEKTPPGPANPLGPVKMILEEGIRIHGTNAPGSIGRAASHACMRMKSEEARELAWEIQQRYSEKVDPQLLDVYKTNRHSTYWVKLLLNVPVEIEYHQVEIIGDKVWLHPDRYGKGGFEKSLEDTLATAGIDEVILDKKSIQKLNQMRRKGSAELTLRELRSILTPNILNEGFDNSTASLSSAAQDAIQ